MVAAGLAGAPEFVEIAGEAAGGAEEDVGGFGEGVDGADHFALGKWRSFADGIEAIDFFFPVGAIGADAGGVAFFDLAAGDGGLEFLERGAGVACERKRGVFVGVEFGDVDIDEAYRGILESGFGGGGEIGVAGADANDEVGFAGGDVCAGCAGDANGAKLLRVVVGQGAFAGLRFAGGDAGGFGEICEGAGGFGIENAAAGDDERVFCLAD